MPAPLNLHPDRLLPAEPGQRAIARRLYATVQGLPILSPHGHTDPGWFADNRRFANPTELLLAPDHYLYRMLYSQGIKLESLGIRPRDASAGAVAEVDPRQAWQIFAAHYHLFRGTPSRLWLDQVFAEVFGMTVRLEAATADAYYDAIDAALHRPEFRPRALFDRFGIEVLTTTESPLDGLERHAAIGASGWTGRILTAYRPDPVVDPEFEGFRDSLAAFGELTGEDTSSWSGYLAAHRLRRGYFKAAGCTSTDHGHPTARTADLPPRIAEALFERVVRGATTPEDAELFRAQMLTEMARMSLDDGLVMQIHPGSFRNHNATLHGRFGRDRGADIPRPTGYVDALKPLLDRFGNETGLVGDRVHARREQLLARAGAARRSLPGAATRPGVVVPRQPERLDALPRTDQRDRGFLQHRRFQRRHARAAVDPCTARRRAARRLQLPRTVGRGAPDRRGRSRRGRRRPRLSLAEARVSPRLNPRTGDQACTSTSVTRPTPIR